MRLLESQVLDEFCLSYSWLGALKRREHRVDNGCSSGFEILELLLCLYRAQVLEYCQRIHELRIRQFTSEYVHGVCWNKRALERDAASRIPSLTNKFHRGSRGIDARPGTRHGARGPNWKNF